MTGRVDIDPAKVKDVLEELLPIGDGAMPSSVFGWHARSGHWRRMRADYPNGARLTVFFGKGGRVSSCKASLSAVFRAGQRHD